MSDETVVPADQRNAAMPVAVESHPSRWVRPLRVHLSVIIVLLLMGVSGPIMWLSYQQGRGAALTDAEERMGQLSQHTIDRYRALMGDGYSLVTVASVIPALMTKPTENLDAKTRFLLKSLDGSPYVNSIYAGYADGGFVQAASVDRNIRWMTVSGAPRGTAYAVRTIERPATGPSSTWRFLDKQGQIIGQKVSNEVLFDPRQRPWYRAARDATGPVSVGPYVTAATQTLTQTIAVPMAGLEGAVVGVDVMLEMISQSLARDAVSENARGFVFDYQKKLIVHSDEAIMKQILDSYGTASRDESGDAAVDPAVDEVRELLRPDDNEDGRTVMFSVDGSPYVARIAAIGFSDNVRGNTVVLVAPVSDFIGASARLLKKNLLVAGLFLTTGILAALLFARLISRALLALSEDARHIGNLEFEVHKPSASWISEINTLTTALGSAREAIKTFALYVPRELVRRIVTAGQASAGQAVRQEVTVLFTDIRDFTTISEVHTPEDVVGMLSDYFELMNGIVERHQGVIIQYLGDSIYAMWNAPTADPRHVDDGCRCALALKTAIDDLNVRSRAVGRPELVTRFGLHTGIAVVGSVGALSRQQYTAMQRERERLAVGIEMITNALRRGGRVVFVGAGTSGRLGILESAEMPPTFSTDPLLVQAVMAGGREAIFGAKEGVEDNYEEGARAMTRFHPTRADVVIGVSASGMTQFVRGALTRARKAGTRIIFVTCDPATELQTFVDLTIAPAVGAEVIAGSTRLKAGTATKLVLNTLTTGAMVRIGKTYGNLMVDVHTGSEKLKDRACRIVNIVTGLDYEESERLLTKAHWNVKAAIVMQKTGLSLVKSLGRLRKAHDSMREAIGEDIEPRLKGMLQGHAEAAASVDTEAGAGSSASSAAKRGARSK